LPSFRSPPQRDYFCRAAGTNRFTWNWGLAEWNRQHEAGLKPSAMRAINLQRLATATALRAAKLASNGDTATGKVPAVDGKVTPARHEFGQQDGSGQEKNRAHLCTPS
jgi:putative transposase